MTNVQPFFGRISFDSGFVRKGKAIDPNSLLKIGRNERVESFKDFEILLSYPLDLDNINFDFRPGNLSGSVILFISGLTPDKPEAEYSTEDGSMFPFAYRYAASTFMTEELVKSQGEEAIKNHLSYYVDTIEAASLHQYLAFYAFNLDVGFGPPPVDMRDIYSRLRAGILDLECGTENIYYEVPSIVLYPSFYAPAVRTNTDFYPASTQWFQFSDFVNVKERMVKVAFVTNTSLVGYECVVAYSDWLVESFKRYYLEVFEINRVSDRIDERNTYRIVFERYSVWSAPIIRLRVGGSLGGSRFIIPAVVSRIDQATTPPPYELPFGAVIGNPNAMSNFVS